MKITDLYKVLPTALENNMNVLLKGAPGLGKSDIIIEIVNKMNYRLLIQHPIVSNPIDYKGLPVSGVVNGELTADFIPYGDLQDMITTKKPLVVLFDDVGQAPVSVQAALMQLILAREINGKKISKHVRFIAATNDKNQNAGVSGLITPLLSRFAGVFTIDIDSDAWIKWALKNNMPAELVAYINIKPAMLSTFDAKNKNVENFACPRTIANLGKWINLGVIDLETWSGAVGDVFAVDFKAFYDIQQNIVPLMSNILTNPKTAQIINNPGQLFFVMTALSNIAAKDTTDAKFNMMMDYIIRLPEEYQAFFMTCCTTKRDSLKQTSGFIHWHVKNQAFVV